MRKYNEMSKPLFDMSRFTVDTKTRGSARGEQLDRFLERLNPSREAAGYKPLTHARLSQYLSHIKTEDLHAFYKQCDSGNNFSKLFWWYVKPK